MQVMDLLNGSRKGLFNFAQQTLPQLLEAVPDSPHPPTLIVTGATASIRGSARFATFAASKFAARGITQSLSREFHPKGVHVAHAIIDAVIDIPRTKDWVVNDGKEGSKISPDSVSVVPVRKDFPQFANRRRSPRAIGICTPKSDRASRRSWI
jgi:NAD(P)-dependent dehydrogenase (short-subunit alcohol dehydrogenase family)